jgi:hypothetical protein
MNPQPYPIIDGFVMSTKLRCALTFRDIATQEYELLRRASAMRNKMWLAPKDSSILIPPYDSFEYQVSMKPGSAIWGWTFVAATGNQNSDVPDDVGTLSFEVRDACDDIPIFSEVCTRTRIASGVYPQQYLSKLLIVGPPGLLNFVICNTYAAAQMGQVVLYGGEPAL